MRKLVLAAVLGLGVLPAVAGAQVTRNQQLTQAQAAYDGFDAPRALTLLRAALDPGRGPQDDVWGRGVQLLAQILSEDQKPAEADIWLLWAFRLNPAIAIDSVTFLPAVVAAARRAKTAAGTGVARDSAVRSSWEWAAAGFTDTEGGLRTSSQSGTSVQVLVEGVGLATPGQAMRLRPGSYNLQVSASGFVSTRVTREVLPRTVTSLQFQLVSTAAAALAAADTVLPAAASEVASRRVALLQAERYDIPAAPTACATGFVVDRGGLIATSYRAIRGADRLTVDLGAGRRLTAEVRVAAYDVPNDIALLSVPVALTDSMPIAGTIGTGALWAVGFGDCRTATSRRTAITAAPSRPDALSLGSRLADGFRGAPLVDRNGNALGLVAGPDSGFALSRLAPVLARARQAIAAGPLSAPADVSRRENHLYGTVTVRSGTTGAVVRVRPLESWQWAELAREGPAPFTFTGPMGRYEVTLLIGGTNRRQTTATVNPGTRTQLTLDPQVAQATPAGGGAQPPPGGQTGLAPAKGKSKLPFIIGGGAVGVGVLAAVVLGGGGEKPEATGSLNVRVPVNP